MTTMTVQAIDAVAAAMAAAPPAPPAQPPALATAAGEAHDDGAGPGTLSGPVVPAASATAACPGDGAEALSLMARFYQHYDYWTAPQYADLLAAWSLQCHATEDDGSPIWRALARLVISGMAGCGKSATLDNVAMMTGAIIPVDLTFAGIRDAIGKFRRPVIIDDAQLVFGATGKAAERVRKVVNAHTKGRSGLDASGEITVHGNIAMAGLPDLITGKPSVTMADTLSRCFVLLKERKPRDLFVPEVSDTAQALAREKMVPGMRDWCAAYRDDLRARAAEFGAGTPTGLPDLGGGGRGNDQLARSLLAVCDVATALVPDEIKETVPADEWDWSGRIRRALIYVSGVPEPTPDEGSPLDAAAAAFEALWAADREKG